MRLEEFFYRFSVILIVSLFIGLQREYAHQHEERTMAAGVRTFPLMGLLGGIAVFLSTELNSVLPFVFLLLSISIYFSVSYYVISRDEHKGLTTNIAALLMIFIGGIIALGHVLFGIVVSVVTAYILTGKKELHAFVEKVGQKDIYAVIKFAVITFFILPLLPKHPIGPYPFNVIILYKIWLLVVLISGISFIGYILNKLFGSKKSIQLTGILGGLASSTAVTLSLTQLSQNNDEQLSKQLSLAIHLAWIVMFIRVLVEVAVIHAELLVWIWKPYLVMMGTLLGLSLLTHFKHISKEHDHDIKLENPFLLMPAIKFGALFTVIFILSKISGDLLNQSGYFISTFVIGMVDVDAVSLSVAELSQGYTIPKKIEAAQAIYIASVANTLTKCCIVLFLGGKTIKKYVLMSFFILVIASIVGFVFI